MHEQRAKTRSFDEDDPTLAAALAQSRKEVRS
jgi:hypothetical protein